MRVLNGEMSLREPNGFLSSTALKGSGHVEDRPEKEGCLSGNWRITAAFVTLLLTGHVVAQTAPTIILQPISQTVISGGRTTLTVVASGPGPFTYQWRCNGTNVPRVITTVAGGGCGDGGVATNAVLFMPRALATDANGRLFIADWYNNRVRRLDTNGAITTVAGNGLLASTFRGAYSGDGGPATNASLYLPAGVAVSGDGTVFIADSYNHRVRKVDTNGIITTVAGNGATVHFGSIYYGTYSGDGGPAVDAGLNRPAGVALDSEGNLFIADNYNDRIRKVDANGIITTIAGNGNSGYSGDRGWATNASLSSPVGVAVDSAGAIFILDEGNNRIRRITNGIITSLAASASVSSMVGFCLDALGNFVVADESGERVWRVATNGATTLVAGKSTYGFSGDGGAATNATFSGPSGVALDGAGNLFIADAGNNRIRKVTPDGLISTVAGTGFGSFGGDGGPATKATLATPFGLAFDSLGNLFIAESRNDRVRKVSPDGLITTVAGNTNSGYSGDGVAATNTSLYSPAGVAVDPAGNLFIADVNNHRIRQVNTNGIIATVAGTGFGSVPVSGQPATNAPLDFPDDVALDAGGNLLIADGNINRVFRVDTNGILTTIAGNAGRGYSGDGDAATNSTLYNPVGIALDGTGNVLIADYFNNRIRSVDTNGIIGTVAGVGPSPPDLGTYGGDDGPATSANLWGPARVLVDREGNLFISDSENQRIRKVDTNGIITTVVGDGNLGYANNNAPTNASICYPGGLAMDPQGNLFFADSGNHRVRMLPAPGPNLALNNVTLANACDYDVIIMNAYGSVTSYVATVTVALPRLQACLNPDGTVSLFMSAAPGAFYSLQTTTSLAEPVTWQTVSTHPAEATGKWTFTDTHAALQARFYRATAP
ncbi:MAG TPA: hypothetical protein VJA21_23280 [Verrucomicrobiae bacterium]